MNKKVTANLEAIGEILGSAISVFGPDSEDDLETVVEQALTTGAALVGKADACSLVAMLVIDLQRHMRSKSQVLALLNNES